MNDLLHQNGGIRPRSIAPYELDPSELVKLNKADWQFDAQNGAVLVHDMQRYWLDPFLDQAFVGRIRNLIDAGRKRGMPIVYTGARVAVSDVDRGVACDLFGPGIGRTRDATPGDTEIVDSLAPLPSDLVISKPRYSGFYDTSLEQELRRRGVTDLAICGVFAHHGCMVTAIDAFMRGFRVHFVVDAMGDHDLESHRLASAYIAETSGVNAVTDSLIDQIQALPA